MNGAHLRTVLWLRWRLMVNQFSRMSLVSRLISWFFFAGGAIFAVSSFFASWSTAAFFLPRELPGWLIYVWDACILIYLFSHLAGLINELQQSETLSLDKFLHLPVSPRGVFLLNFFNSAVNLSLATFLPMMLGLSTAQVFRYGWSMAAAFPLILAFFFMVTALTHQFKGWLAALMQDKRRKRTLMALGTLLIVVVALTPAMIDRTVSSQRDKTPSFRQQTRELEEKLKQGKLQESEFQKETERLAEARRTRRVERLRVADQWGQIANHVLPPAWLALGVTRVGQGDWLIPLGCLGGMACIGLLSLSRSYRTALGVYRGTFTGGKRGTSRRLVVNRTGATNAAATRPRNWLEYSWPLLSEQQSAIAMLSLRSFARAPEAKLAIIFPLVAIALLGGTSLLQQQIPSQARALVGLGISFFVMLGITQLIQNQFGFDRDGFRCLMLVPVTERDILIGKNAALAPFALVMAGAALMVVQLITPLKWSHFLATFCQLGSLYLVTALVGNLMSIVVPLAMKSGSLKPVNLKMGAALMQIVIFLFAPLGMLPAVAPLGIELVLTRMTGGEYPIYLAGALLYLLILIPIYGWVVRWEGMLLHERKISILEAVTSSGN